MGAPRARRRPRPSRWHRPAARSWLSPKPAPPSRRRPPAFVRRGAWESRPPPLSCRPPSRHGRAPAPPLPARPERSLRATPAAPRPVSAGPAWGAGGLDLGVLGIPGCGALRRSRGDAARGRKGAFSPELGAARCARRIQGVPTPSPPRAAAPQKARLRCTLAPGPSAGPAPCPTRCPGTGFQRVALKQGRGRSPLGAPPPSSCDL